MEETELTPNKALIDDASVSLDTWNGPELLRNLTANIPIHTFSRDADTKGRPKIITGFK